MKLIPVRGRKHSLCLLVKLAEMFRDNEINPRKGTETQCFTPSISTVANMDNEINPRKETEI